MRDYFLISFIGGFAGGALWTFLRLAWQGFFHVPWILCSHCGTKFQFSDACEHSKDWAKTYCLACSRAREIFGKDRDWLEGKLYHGQAGTLRAVRGKRF